MPEFSDFLELGIKVGTIIEINDFPNARKPAYQLKIDFGEKLGIKQSSAQITNYSKEELMNKQIIAVTGFPKKQIANFFSECLVLGFVNKEEKVILLEIPEKAENGTDIC